MFFLSTPFPHLLPFVLKGAWQIGRGLQAMHRKLWNTMNGAGTDPHPPQNITSSSIQRPRGGTAGAHNPVFAPFIVFLPAREKAPCPKGCGTE